MEKIYGVYDVIEVYRGYKIYRSETPGEEGIMVHDSELLDPFDTVEDAKKAIDREEELEEECRKDWLEFLARH